MGFILFQHMVYIASINEILGLMSYYELMYEMSLEDKGNPRFNFKLWPTELEHTWNLAKSGN